MLNRAGVVPIKSVTVYEMNRERVILLTVLSAAVIPLINKMFIVQAWGRVILAPMGLS